MSENEREKRQARLAQALRENMRKRRAQAKSRSASPPPTDDAVFADAQRDAGVDAQLRPQIRDQEE